MESKRPHAYLEYLLHDQEGKDKLRQELDFRMNRIREDNIQWHPVLGEYLVLSWDTRADKNKDIRVLPNRKRKNPLRHERYHAHDFFEIVYVYAGQCQTHFFEQPTLLQAGDICLYDLQAIHKVECFGEGDVAFVFLISKKLFRQLLIELLSESDLISAFFINTLYNRKSTDNCILLKRNGQYQCEALAQQIIETYFRGKPMSQSAITAQMMLLLLEIARQHRAEQTSAAAQCNLHIEDILSYINTNFRDVALDSTARHFKLSTRSLTRFLKKNTGFSFREVVQDLRFSRARSMLQDTYLSIEEISADLGYRDRSNFEIAFKKYCHITPAAYRRQFQTK